MSASEKNIGRKIVSYLKSEALVGRINKQKINTLASSMGVLNKVKSDFDDSVSEPESRSNLMGSVLNEWCSSGTMKSNNGYKLISLLESTNMNLQAQAVKTLLKESDSRGLIKAPIPYTPTSSSSISSNNGLDSYLKGSSSKANGRSHVIEDDEFNITESSRNSAEFVDAEKMSTSEEDNVQTLIEDVNSFNEKEQNNTDNKVDEVKTIKKISEGSSMKPVSKRPGKKRQIGSKTERKPTPMVGRSKDKENTKSLRKPIKKKQPEKIREVEEEENRSYNIYKNEMREKKSASSSFSTRQRIGNNAATTTKMLPMNDIPSKKTSSTDKKSGKFSLSRHNLSSSSSSMSGTTIINGSLRLKNKRQFDDESDRSEKSDYDFDDGILEEEGEDDISVLSMSKSKVQRGIGYNNISGHQSVPRKSRSMSSMARSSREQSPEPSSRRNRRSKLSRATSESPIKHKQPEETKSGNEESFSKLEKRKNYSTGVFGRRRQKKILRVRPTEANPSGDGQRYSKFGTWKEIRKAQRLKKKEKEEADTLHEDIKDILMTIDYLTEKEIKEGGISESIHAKIKHDNFLYSMCTHDKEILSMLVSVYTSFGSKMVIQTRTQIMIWHILEKVRRFWMYTNQPLPTYQEILQDSETAEFLKAISNLSYIVMNTDTCILTGYMEHDRAKHKLYISFRQQGIKVVKKQLDTLGIAEYAEDGYGLGGSGMEVQFVDCPLVDFLASVHSHISTCEESLSKNKLFEGLPYLCGLSSEENSEGQRVVIDFLKTFSGILPKNKDPSYYLESLNRLWEETQLVFLSCAYEARLRKIQAYPPPDNSKVINLGLTKLHHHELITLSWYLGHLDTESVTLEALMLQDCDIDDEGLCLLGKHVFQKTRKLLLSGNQLSVEGLHSCFKMWKQTDKCLLRSLDMSNCALDDESLVKLSPLLPYLEELYLNDNFFTWYGIRKISQTRRKTKRLRKLELGRCNINDHAFYELIPLILKTETVILDGNEIYPLELRIFARNVREKTTQEGGALRLQTLVLSNCGLLDDCLHEISRCITDIPSIDLRNNKFTLEGLKVLGKHCRKRNMGVLKSINFRGCGLTSDDLEGMADVFVRFESLNLAGNYFKAKPGVEEFCQALASEDRRLKFVDFRHCRLHEQSKKLIQDSCRKLKIDSKIF